MPDRRIKQLNVKQQVNPIVRENDNSTAISRQLMRVRTKWSKIAAPDSSVPGKSRTSPPLTETNLP